MAARAWWAVGVTAVLLALGAAACGGGGGSGGSGAGGDGAGAGGAGGGAAAVALPVVGCSTEHGLDETLDGVPKGLPATRPVAGLEAGAAAGLAWYEGDTSLVHELALLAPRGWTCEAMIAVNGSWWLRVSPPADGPLGDFAGVGVSGQYGMPAATAACTFFPAAAEGLDDGESCGPLEGVDVTARSDHAVRYAVAAQDDVPGSLGLQLWYADAGQASVAATCMHPEDAVCTAVLDEAEARLAQLVEDEVQLSGSG